MNGKRSRKKKMTRLSVYTKAVLILGVTTSIFISQGGISKGSVRVQETSLIISTNEDVSSEQTDESDAFVSEEQTTEEESESATAESTEPVRERFTEDEINFIARVVMAEAEGESELGKRLVADVIFNRVDSPRFPNTVNGVLYQKHQFQCLRDGRINQCPVKSEFVEIVRQEMNKRTNADVFFFRTKRYHSFGTKLFKEDHHYFSGL